MPLIRETLSKYLREASLLSAPIFGGIAIFGPWLDLVFGHRFHFDPMITLALALGYYISAVLGPMGYSLSMTGRHRLEFGLLCGGATLIVALCVIVTPLYGALGTALVIAAGYLAINGARAVLVQRVYHFFVGSPGDLVPPLLSLGLAFLFREFGQKLLGRSVGSMVVLLAVYLVGCFAGYWMFLFKENELRFFRSRFSRLARGG